MSYRIQKGEALAAALGRIAAEEMDVALTELHRPERGESIHNVRKAIKRMRALLRSLRVVFPRQMFRAENRRLAEAAREISPMRDVHVQLRTLAKLKGAKKPSGGRARRELLRRKESFVRSIPELRRAVRGMLGGARGTIDSWPLDKTTPATLVLGLQRIYKQGRKAFKAVCEDCAPENLHEWRKKVKALGYGFELLEDLLSRKLAKRLKLCQELGELLGDDHDLFMVLESLAHANRSRPGRDYPGLVEQISARRAKLQKRAFKLGKKVYRQKPGAFADRLERHLSRS
jgi:CHAD domain-containing protein